MTATIDRPAIAYRPPPGGQGAGRRAVVRWAWRLFRREWRQHLLILVLIGAAVGATIVGAAVAADSPPPANAGFGTASDAASFAGSDPRLSAEIASLRRFGTLDVIENEAMAVPGSVDTFNLRSQDPRGAFGKPMLNLVSGRYPTGPGEVAMTSDLAKTLDLKIGSQWQQAGQDRRVVGVVQNPQSLLDAFALVSPGQVTAPTQVTVLFDAPNASPSELGPNVQTAGTQQNVFNPETIVLALATVGLLLIGLVAVAGFTVIAQRRLRAIGMLGAVGATDKNIRLVVRANGVVVGVVGTLIGAVVGFGAWLAYRPRLESSVHHLIGTFQVPWTVVGPAMGLAVITSYLAASRPARSMTRVPIVTALSGRPAPPRRTHRSAIPGIALLVAAFLLLTWAAASNGNGAGAIKLVLGFVALATGLVLLAPLAISVIARLTSGTSVGVRLAIRDLNRYRARSGSALGAISLAVLIAVLVCVATAARYGNMLDYTGPNLTSTQLIVHIPGDGPECQPQCQSTSGAQGVKMQQAATAIATALGSHNVAELDSTSATLEHAAAGRNWSGPVYVATPQLLQALGIKASAVDGNADIVTMRPGLASMSKMILVFGHYFDTPPSGPNSFPCPASDCIANPKMQQMSALPAGTSAPNTVITEQAVRRLGLETNVSGWLVQTPRPLTAAQIASARQAAANAGLSIETKSEAPTSAAVLNWATAAGILLALGILAMTVGLIRAETARDLRTLMATGASGPTRRTITAATAGALALLGAVLGTVGGYIAAFAWFRSDAGGDDLSSLSSVPIANLAVILIGLPLVAVVAGWLFSGRQPLSIAHQPIE